MTRNGAREGLIFFLLFCLIAFAFHLGAFSNDMLMAPMGDPICQNYPFKQLYSQGLKVFSFPLWDPYEFAGIPFLGNLQTGALYPPNVILYFLLDPALAFNINRVLHFALGALFTFLYIRLIGAGFAAAFAGGMVFGFAGFLSMNADHIMIANATVYLPLMIFLLEKSRRTLAPGFSMLFALTIAVQAFAGNYQIAVYSYMLVFFYVVWHLRGMRKDARARFITLCIGGFLLGVLLSLPQLLPTFELSNLSFMRMKKVFAGYEYFSQFHFYLAELPSLIFGGFFSKWGPQDHIATGIGGAVFLIALAAFLKGMRENANARFWGLVAALSLLLSMGSDTPIHRLLYHLPVYNQFRVVGRHLMEFSLAVSVLFAMGLDVIFSGGERKRQYLDTFIIITLAVAALSVVVVFVLPSVSLDPVIRYFIAKKFVDPWHLKKALSITNPAIYVPLVSIGVYAAWAVIYRFKERTGLRYALLAILVFEIALGYRGYMLASEKGTPANKAKALCRGESYSEVVAGDDSGLYRVANIYSPKEICSTVYNPAANLTCRVGTVNFFNPLAFDDYSILLDLGLSGYYSLSWEHLVKNNIILSMLGTRYVAVSSSMNIDTVGIVAGKKDGTLETTDISPSRWMLRHGSSVKDGGYMLEGRDGKLAEVVQNLKLREGAYEFCLDARADEKDKYLAAYFYAPPEYKKTEALFVHPDYIGPEYSEFCRVVHIEGASGPYLASIVTASIRPVHIRDISIRRLKDYGPYSLNTGLGEGEGVYEKVAQAGKADVYLNRNAMPRAWSVTGLVPVEGIFDIKRKLDALEVDVSNEAMVEKDDIGELGGRSFARGKVVVSSHGMNWLDLDTEFDGEGFVVLSEQYYPGWRAYVDEKKTRIYRTNGVLRGIVVPKGSHRVGFRYRPGMFLAPLFVDIALVFGISLILWTRRRQMFSGRAGEKS